MPKYTFAVGIAQTRKITVERTNEIDARIAAREKLDRIAERKGNEVPVSWDLTLLSVDS